MSRKKHVVITGGAKGIGESCSRLFNRDGYNVSILDIDEIAGNELTRNLGETAKFFYCNVALSENITNAFDQALNHFGDIDVLVNNVGVIIYGTVTSTTEDLWDQTMNINLKSYFLAAQLALPSMQRIGKGVVINVSSVQAYISQANVAAYTTAKSALLGLTRSIAIDYAPEIRCIAICPGTIDTPMLEKAIHESPNPEEILQECNDMHLTKRIGTPDEVGELIVFVAGDKAGFMTGQSIRIDGGLGITIAGSKKEA